MCIWTNGVGEGDAAGTRVPAHNNLGTQAGLCISFTNIDVIYYCLQNFLWTNQTITNFIYALFHLLIDSSVKK